jgi:hypothetical protein
VGVPARLTQAACHKSHGRDKKNIANDTKREVKMGGWGMRAISPSELTKSQYINEREIERERRIAMVVALTAC